MTGETIAGRYRLLEPLGRSAMSAVWLAHDDELERQVAVKMLAPSADRARFEREARAAAALSHPNICALYDYGEADGRPYMVLEYLPNGSLEERLRDGRPLADDETLRIATELAAGLAHAHGRGLVHRDLKPANVLFDTEERAKIADFGIARMGGSGTLTEAGTVLGTASYISPEQAGGAARRAAERRLLVRRDPVPDAHRARCRSSRATPWSSCACIATTPPPAVTAVRPDAPAGAGERSSLPPSRRIPAARPADGDALLRALQARRRDRHDRGCPGSGCRGHGGDTGAASGTRPAQGLADRPGRCGRRAAPRGRRRTRDRPHEQRLERQLAAGRVDAAERPECLRRRPRPRRRRRPRPRRRRQPQRRRRRRLPPDGTDHDERRRPRPQPSTTAPATTTAPTTTAAPPTTTGATTTDTTPVTTTEGTTTTAAP